MLFRQAEIQVAFWDCVLPDWPCASNQGETDRN